MRAGAALAREQDIPSLASLLNGRVPGRTSVRLRPIMKGLDCEAGDSGSGWHNSHLRGLAQNFGNDERAKSVVDKLDEHGARFASGELDPWYLRLLLIKRLLSARKPGGGGVRPIGIGCALRRLLSAGTRAAHKDTVHAYLSFIHI